MLKITHVVPFRASPTVRHDFDDLVKDADLLRLELDEVGAEFFEGRTRWLLRLLMWRLDTGSRILVGKWNAPEQLGAQRLVLVGSPRVPSNCPRRDRAGGSPPRNRRRPSRGSRHPCRHPQSRPHPSLSRLPRSPNRPIFEASCPSRARSRPTGRTVGRGSRRSHAGRCCQSIECLCFEREGPEGTWIASRG